MTEGSLGVTLCFWGEMRVWHHWIRKHRTPRAPISSTRSLRWSAPEGSLPMTALEGALSHCPMVVWWVGVASIVI